MKPVAPRRSGDDSRGGGAAPSQATTGRFPAVRMRRNRKTGWARRLVAENALSPADLIWPIFVVEGSNKRLPVPSMPGVDRLSVDLAVAAAEQAVALGIPAVALFPYTDPKLRTDDGREAHNPDNLAAGLPAPSAKPASTSACCSTWRSIPIPAMATTA